MKTYGSLMITNYLLFGELEVIHSHLIYQWVGTQQMNTNVFLAALCFEAGCASCGIKHWQLCARRSLRVWRRSGIWEVIL